MRRHMGSSRSKISTPCQIASMMVDFESWKSDPSQASIQKGGKERRMNEMASCVLKAGYN